MESRCVFRQFIWLIVMVVSVVTGLYFSSLSVEANQLTFSIKPHMPQNQVSPEAGYYDLKVTPGQQQSLTLTYTNNTNKKITISTEASAATTNDAGNVDYGDQQASLDKSLQTALPSMVTLPGNVTLNPNQSKDIQIEIRVPEKRFEGMIAGGLTFKDQEADEKKKDTNTDVTLINVYHYQLGILLRERDEPFYDTKIVDTKGLHLQEVKAGQINARNVILAHLQNPLSQYLNDFTVFAKVVDARTNKVVLTTNHDKMQMAPNSSFDYGIRFKEGQKLVPGKYIVELTAFANQNDSGRFITPKNEKFDYKWHFTKAFMITADEANRLNRKDVTVSSFNYWWLLILLLLLVSLLLFLIWLNRRVIAYVERSYTEAGDEKLQRKYTTVRRFNKLKNSGRDVWRLDE